MLFYNEVNDLKKAMQTSGARTSQQVMGEPEKLMKIHTRDLSRIFRSKKEIYQILLIEGQYYLPPIEDCTIDYLRDLFCGKKKVSIINLTCYSIYLTIRLTWSMFQRCQNYLLRD
jgi:hypothetical protein